MTEQKITINISNLAILKIVGVLFALLIIYFIADILQLLFIAVIFSAIIEPSVNFMEKNRIPRSLGVISIYVAVLLFLFVVIKMIIPPIAEQVTLLSANFPDLWNRFTENFQSLRQYSTEHGLTDNIKNSLNSLQGGLQQAASGAYSFLAAIFKNIVDFIVVMVITFYLAVQKDSIAKLFQVISPAKYHQHVGEILESIHKKIGDWARGVLLLGAIIGLLSFMGLIFILPKYALVLALLAAFTELIPYLGPVLGAIPAVFLGLTVPPFSWGRGLAVLILYIVIQQLENNVIVPQVMKRQVGLNPVVTIIAMMVGIKVAGIIGIILAIPVTLIIAIISKDVMSNLKWNKVPKTLDDGAGSE